MSSNINPNNIDTDYPIAGHDNDSQGFRDNFTNIKTNFTNSRDEINDLQEQVILKKALLGGTLNNDMDGEVIKSALMQNLRVPSGPTTGVMDVSDKSYYTLTTGATTLLGFDSWPEEGQVSKVTIEIEVTDTAHAIELPAAAMESAAGLQGYNALNNEITYTETGFYIYEFTSIDVGTTITVTELSRSGQASPSNLNFYRTITTTFGEPGDTQGMIAFDGNYAYFCRGDYTTGTGAIWTRVATAVW